MTDAILEQGHLKKENQRKDGIWTLNEQIRSCGELDGDSLSYDKKGYRIILNEMIALLFCLK